MISRPPRYTGYRYGIRQGERRGCHLSLLLRRSARPRLTGLWLVAPRELADEERLLRRLWRAARRLRHLSPRQQAVDAEAKHQPNPMIPPPSVLQLRRSRSCASSSCSTSSGSWDSSSRSSKRRSSIASNFCRGVRPRSWSTSSTASRSRRRCESSRSASCGVRFAAAAHPLSPKGATSAPLRRGLRTQRWGKLRRPTVIRPPAVDGTLAVKVAAPLGILFRPARRALARRCKLVAGRLVRPGTIPRNIRPRASFSPMAAGVTERLRRLRCRPQPLPRQSVPAHPTMSSRPPLAHMFRSARHPPRTPLGDLAGHRSTSVTDRRPAALLR